MCGMRRFLMTTISVLALTASVAQAETSHDGFSFGPSVSTLGAGGELGYRFHDYFGLRGKVQALNAYDGDGEADDINYEYDVKLFTAGAVADYYPLAGGLRLTVGAYYNDNRVTANNTGGSTITVGGVPVPITENQITADGHYNRVAPYLGVGYDGQLGSGFAIGFDLGVLYQGRAKVDVRRNNPLIPADDAEDVREEIKDAMNKLKVYPVVGLNLLYKF
jgi:hypothetical protein